MRLVEEFGRLLKKAPFRLKAFSVNLPIVGFLFERKERRVRAKRKAAKSPLLPTPPPNPLLDTLDNLRKQAMKDGDWETAFGSAFFQLMLDPRKNQNQQGQGS